MKLFNVIKIAIVATVLQMSFVKASDTVGIVASIAPNMQRAISLAVDSRTATQTLIDQTNHPKSEHIYWLDRNDSETYHVTLELLSKTDKSQFTSVDLNDVETICKNFNAHARHLNANHQKTGKKAYVGNGYELRLFVHYVDGTHEQFKAKNIVNLMKSRKDVAYANIVLKLGTHGGLKKDWSFTRDNILTRPNHAHLTRIISHELETHITIGSLYKYTKQQNQIVGKSVQRKNGKKGFSTPFLCAVGYEMQMLVDTFTLINAHINQNALQGICLDRLQVTGKDQNGNIGVLREVIFN